MESQEVIDALEYIKADKSTEGILHMFGVRHIDEILQLTNEDLVMANLTPTQAEWRQKMALEVHARRWPQFLQPGIYNEILNYLENSVYAASNHERKPELVQSTEAQVACRTLTAPRVVTKVTNLSLKHRTRTRMSIN